MAKLLLTDKELESGMKISDKYSSGKKLVYGPYPEHKDHVVLKWDIACRPCYRNFKLPVCDRDKECLKSVSVEDVFAASHALLS